MANYFTKALLAFYFLFISFVAFAQVQISATGSTANQFDVYYPANFAGFITPGITITFKSNQTIDGTTPTTIVLNGITKTIKKHVNLNLAAYDILNGQFVTITFDGTNFQMTSLTGPGSIGINNGSAPNASALLDVDATGMSPKGILIPRISLTSTSDVTTIPSPANSLMVYNTNVTMTNGNGAGYYFYNTAGTKWIYVTSPNNGPGTNGQVLTSGGAGSGAAWTTPTTGTVTSFSSGNLAPLFTTTVSSPAIAPSLSFSISNANAYTLLGNNTAGLAAPTFFAPTLASALFANQGTATTILHGGAGGGPTWGAIVNNDITNNTIDLTTKVTGVLPLANGGSNANLTAVNGGAVYSTGTAMAITAVGTAGQVLKSNGAAAPTWQADNNSGGTVTSVSGTAPVVSSGGATPAISMAVANTTTNGYLSSGDWNTFNGKVGGSGTATQVAFWNAANTLSSNANLFWDNSNSRLGIGTASPSYLLDINSTTDVFANISSNASATGTLAGIRLSMYGGYTGMHYDLSSEKNDATANSGASDLVLRQHFSTAGDVIKILKVSQSTRNITFNESITSGGTYGNFIVANGNVGIGITSPDASSILDVNSATKGMLIPRLSQAQRDAIVNPATSLIIYQNDNTPGYYYNSGLPSAPGWVQLINSGLPPWSTTGNSGTNPATSYIGTSDAQDLVFKTSATNRINISSTGNIGINASYNATDKVFIERQSTDFGANKTGLFSQRMGSNALGINGGSGWGSTGVDAAIKGNSVWGNQFSAGVAGYNYADDFAATQTAGVIGGFNDNGDFGALAFKDGTNSWGLYTPNNTYIGGSLKMPTGATANYILKTNAVGLTSWADPNSIGPWTKSGTNIYQTTLTDKVGIGTTTPNALLNIRFDGIYNSNANNALILSNNTVTAKGLQMGYDNTIDAAYFQSLQQFVSVKPLVLNAMGGNVGIGTTNPAFNLDVSTSGSTFIQSKSTTGLAGLMIDKGLATSNSYIVYRTSGADKWTAGTIGNEDYNIHNWVTGTDAFVILNSNSNVGIGTSTPTSKLEVVGNVEIPSANNYKYSTAKTHFYSLGTHGWSVRNSSLSTKVDYDTYVSMSGGTNITGYMLYPIHLPDAATVTTIDVVCYDNDAVFAVGPAFAKKSLATNAITPISIPSTVGQLGSIQTISGPINDVIDNTLYSYYIQVGMADNSTNTRVYSVKITYTVLQTD